MKANLRVLPVAVAAALTLVACSSGADTADEVEPSASALPPGVAVYTTDIAPLAEIGGVTIQASAYGSALAAVPGTTDEFYGLTDRGPNVDGVVDGQKVEPTPDFVPQIGRFRLSGGTAELLGTIDLTGPDGAGFDGQVHPGATTGETIVDLNGTVLPQSDHGFDPEGLVALPDGTFWISDEYGPFLVHFDAQGKEIERLSPGHGLPAELALRTPNQGMEGLTITPDGTTLVGMMQSGLRAPGLDGSAKSVPLTRIVTVDLNTEAVEEFGYVLDNPKDTKKAVSAITALSATEFLVVERDGKLAPGANKVIYRIDTADATDIGPDATVPNTEYRADGGGLLIGGRAVETIVGVTDSDTAQRKLTEVGVTPVTKTVALDLGKLVDRMNPKGEIYGHDKVEGIVTPDGGRTLYIVNDSDFGLVGLANDTPPYTLEPKILADGTQDTTEILVVDTTKLPAE
ncbi:esterase-like activity of phytase family protein [Prescottella subtropica]|uniref:esterase-like activity of phytase family protein n=1 Tax=Prescottella subtropica TaxID=2545757 RepID=UPI001F4FDD07|nr:esterase-like activity of phytase family protein [Prescottella subtropica]